MAEANRDAAAECAQRASALLVAGQRERAIGLFEKSLRLWHDGRVAAQLQAARAGLGGGAHAGTVGGDGARAGGGGVAHGGGGANRAAGGADGVRRRPVAPPARAAAPPPPPKPRGTPEQEAFVAEQLQHTELYAVLRVPRGASAADIERSFKRLALKLHPDKNPVGTEAFQKLSAAYEVLRDAERRERYDRFGLTGNEPVAAPMHAGFGGHPFGGGGGGGIDPDDLFRAFFGGGGVGGFPPGVRVHFGGHPQFRRRAPQQQPHRHAGDDDEAGARMGSLMNILAVVFVLLLFSLTAGGGGARAPTYSLERSRDFSQERTTGAAAAADVVAGLPYFVTDATALKLKSDAYLAQRVERSVQGEWFDALQSGCSTERARKQQLSAQLSYARSEERKAALRKALDAASTQSCEQFDAFFGSSRRRRG